MNGGDQAIKYEMDLEDPDQDLLEYAKEHLNEDPDTKLEILAELRDLIYERGECSPHRLDDAFLLRFLRARNFVVRHAHRLMVNYYEFRENNPEFFKDVHFDRLLKIGEAGLGTTQPFYDRSGRRVLFFRLGRWDPEKISVKELFQATLLTLEMGLMEPRSQILGGICVFDHSDITMKHVGHLTTKIIKKILDIMVYSYPVRTHAIHVVNQSAVFKTGYSIVKPFLNKEMKKRLFFHSDLKSLHKHLDPTFLPQRYGGVHPDYSYSEWVEYMIKDEKIRKELQELGYTFDGELMCTKL